MLLTTVDSSPWHGDSRHVIALLRLLLYPIGFVAAAIGTWWYRWKQKVALSWPSVEGCVQFTNIAPLGGSGSYSAILQYSYFVEKYRSGEYTEVFDSEHDADDFVQKMKDQKVPVRYNPKDPDKSLIEEADVEQYIQLPPAQRMAPLR
jgi:hypothetical protein